MTKDERIAQLESLLMQVAPQLDLHFNPKKYEENKREIGFLICAFDFGEVGAMSYVSTAQPEDLKKALLELISKLGGARTTSIRRTGQG